MRKVKGTRRVRARAPRVAVLVDTATGWGRGLIRGISTYGHHHGPWHLWVEPRGPNEPLRPPKAWTGEGIIARVSTHRMAAQLSRYGVPIVNLSGIQLAGVDLPRVTLHLGMASRMAAEYFLQKGFRNFGYVGWTKFQHVQEHYAAFAGAVTKVGAACPQFQLGISRTSDEGWIRQQSRLGKWLQRLAKPAAVFCWARQGLAVLDACSWAGIQVPEQVAVLCGDDDKTLYEACFPSMSGIVISAERIGHTAAEMLDRMMRGKAMKPSTHIRINPIRIAERVSTDTLAVTDSDVAHAVRFIRENVAESIQCEDVAREVAMCRRSLERRFLKALGHSPAVEIRRTRLQRAQMLLATSTQPIPEVAAMSGFGSGMYLSQVMRQEMRMTPLHYRNQTRLTR